MKKIRKLILLFVSLCLFINVTYVGFLNNDLKNFSNKKSSLFQITNVKKTNFIVDFDVETIAEEALQEETDSDNIQFNFLFFNPFDFSFDSLNDGTKVKIAYLKKSDNCKLPLFIRYQNFRL